VAHFFYNTDGGTGQYPVLIQHGFAATSGPYSIGEQLGELAPGDTLLMYENRVGVVAVGTVREHWDRLTHRPPIYYLPDIDGFEHEYRIAVDWCLDLSDHPISIEELRARLGYTPCGAVSRIVKRQAEVEKLIRDRRRKGVRGGKERKGIKNHS